MKVRMRFYTRLDERGCVETACIIWYKDRVGSGCFMGNSIQHPNDEYDEYLGRKLAFRRTLKSVRGEHYRQALRHHFKCHYEPKSELGEGKFVKLSYTEMPIDKSFEVIDDNAVTADEYNELKLENYRLKKTIAEIDKLLGGTGERLKYYAPNEEFVFDNLSEDKREVVMEIIDTGGDCAEMGPGDCDTCPLEDICDYKDSDELTLSRAKAYIRQLDKKKLEV